MKKILKILTEKFEKQKDDYFKYLKDLGFGLKEKRRSNLFKSTKFSSSYNQIWVK